MCWRSLQGGILKPPAERVVADFMQEKTVDLAACLPCPFWRKANNFCGLSEFLLSYVATIELAYYENNP